jgi:hypothetical protein
MIIGISSITLGTPVFGQIVNGGFESPDVATFLALPAGDTTLAPWVVSDVGIDLADVNNGFVVGPASEGNQYVDLDGTPGPGTLSQTFPTTAGSMYQLVFAYANNYVNTPNAQANVRIYASSGDLLGPTLISHSTSVSGSLDWTYFSGNFLATDSSATLEFDSLSLSGSQGGILLDDVQVNAVPEPSTFALAALAATGALFAHRKLQSALKREEH